jgi:hypothetical protein
MQSLRSTAPAVAPPAASASAPRRAAASPAAHAHAAGRAPAGAVLAARAPRSAAPHAARRAPAAPRASPRAATATATEERLYEANLDKPLGLKFARGNDGGAYLLSKSADPKYEDFEVGDKIVEVRRGAGARAGAARPARVGGAVRGEGV